MNTRAEDAVDTQMLKAPIADLKAENEKEAGKSEFRNKVYLGDCIDIMSTLPKNCVDMVFCDLPYGTTQNKWDCPIDFDELWEEYNRVVKPNGAIVLTTQSPFDKRLALSLILLTSNLNLNFK